MNLDSGLIYKTPIVSTKETSCGMVKSYNLKQVCPFPDTVSRPDTYHQIITSK